MSNTHSFEEIKSSKLYKLVISDQNIYNAIYSLESYIFEKGLLDEEDLKTYYRLSDKYDVDFISDYIAECRKKLVKILTSTDNLFDISVYFKIKKYDEDTNVIKYRPMHTAKLLDQICMVCLLQPLMFDDSSGERKLSDLAKLIPHNFFGNIPSCDVSRLFERWQKKYKEYTDITIHRCREYKANHRYNTEVTLDIKEFFPSVNPAFIYEFIIDKLSTSFREVNDQDCIRVIASKLLYFHIDEKNIKPWSEIYYGHQIDGSPTFMARGIPQGLPQSYLFGNLCMIEVGRRMQEVFQNSDSYFYVDDSVIYLNAEAYSSDNLTKNIEKLNKELKNHIEEVITSGSGIDDLLIPADIEFQKGLESSYMIEFHKEGKSSYCSIDEADDQLDGEENLARVPSMVGNIFNTLDEIDDAVSLEKLKAYLEVVNNQIDDLKKRHMDFEDKNPEVANNPFASKLKRMKRFKRYFLFRKLIFEIRNEGELTQKMIEKFKERFSISKGEMAEAQVKKWFENFDEDIFSSECHVMIDMQNQQEAKMMEEQICRFEISLSGVDGEQAEFLYFQRDIRSSIIIKRLVSDPYRSLRSWILTNFKENRNLGQSKQITQLRNFIEKFSLSMFKRGYRDKCFTRFVYRNSNEFKRKILNAYFSEMIGVRASDSLSFIKDNARPLYYTELRLLARLRNRHFHCDEFVSFVKIIDPHDLSNRMGIDMGLMTVLSHFVAKVQKPEWVDSLILTHRIVKGLWYNGSKFLNSYTLHNEEHAVTLINKAVRIVKIIDYFTIKNVDYFILFLACYLHDISMVLHPDLYGFSVNNDKSIAIISDFINQLHDKFEKFRAIDPDDKKNTRLKETGNFMIELFQKIFDFFEAGMRDPHPYESARYIRDSAGKFFNYLCPTILSFVAKVSESHGYDALEVYGLKSEAKDDLISIKYLMILIRLADLLDVANDRVNYHLLRENIKHMSQTSRFHWISHLITDEIRLQATYKSDKKALNDKPITEILNFDLYLNVKYMSALKKTYHCDRCLMLYPNKDAQPAEEYTKSDCITLHIEKRDGCTEEKCPFMCKWVMKKHWWLINELSELNNYLFAVNTSMTKTEINLNIFFRDEYKLDADLIDYVKEYLEQ